MAKAPAEDVLQRGLRLLREWGVPSTGDDEAAVASLTSALGRDPAADVAVAERLGAIAHPASAQALQALAAAAHDKQVQKQVRRSLYRLEQRGVGAPAPAAPAPGLQVGPAPLEGYLSIADGDGDQFIWLVRPLSGGVLYLFAIVNDPDGLREVELAETTRKAVKSGMRDLAEQNQIVMVPADWRYCDYAIDRAVRWAAETGLHTSGDYRALRSRLTDQPVRETDPPIFGVLDVADVRADAAALADSAVLLDDPEFRTWLLPRAAVQPYIDELKRVQESPILLPPIQQRERAREIEERAVAEIFAGAQRASWVRRLQTMAFVLHHEGQVDLARRALAAALALEASPRGALGIPLFEAMASMALLACTHEDEAHATQEASDKLVLSPQEALRDLQRGR